MTVDDPPADFAADLLAELPSDLAPATIDDPDWAEDEIDRRLDYAERALDGEIEGDAAAAARLHFARAGLLAVEAAEEPLADARPSPPAESTWISVRMRLAAARLRRAVARQSSVVVPWCAAPPLVEPRLARLP